MLNLLRHRAQRDEQGNLVIAITILMIFAVLSTAILARSTYTLTNTRRTQDFNAALSAADGGLAQAAYRIDMGESSSFNGTATIGSNSYQYKGIMVDQNTWTIRSLGTSNGRTHAAEETIYRTVQFPYALFTNQSLTLNGNTNGGITSFNSSSGATNTGQAAIGSNGAITLNGGGGGDEQDYYTPNGSCSGCANGKQKNGPMSLANPVAPTSYQACPATGVFGTVVAGVTVIDGGGGTPYYCTKNISFVSGNIKVVNGPVIIYLDNNYTVSMADSIINANGHAKDFRLIKTGTGSFDVGNGSHVATVTGVIWAPQSTVTVNGGQLTLDGSMTLNDLRVNGGPNLTVRYDSDLLTLAATTWQNRDWHEIPSASY